MADFATERSIETEHYAGQAGVGAAGVSAN